MTSQYEHSARDAPWRMSSFDYQSEWHCSKTTVHGKPPEDGLGVLGFWPGRWAQALRVGLHLASRGEVIDLDAVVIAIVAVADSLALLLMAAAAFAEALGEPRKKGR